ncbi:SICA antigen [Plasmodium coatneyi]|uniref:SICA antigen n=1 Tax=Plasmodium coatneyi TaxID=208452 RepID=A0A1B1E190_9APIC|nr:SICA antigen [Plasmodium coatneyi]ANQ08609.1 SICA antigen [Plasmodium coatneyi]
MSSTKGEDQDKVFGPLKKEWLEKKGFKGNEGVGELYQEIGKWINVILGEMIKEEKDIDETYKEQCEKMNKGTKNMTEEEKKICAFILANLLKIWTMDKTEKGEEEIDKRIKEHLYCAMLNMWLHEYQNVNCEAQNIMNSAYGAMNYLCQQLGIEGKCKNCEYKQLEPMMIREKIPMLGVIRGGMKNKGKIMGVVFDAEKKKDCPKPNTDPSTAQPPKVTGATAADGETTVPVPVTTSTTAATAKPYQFLTKLLELWIRARGVEKVDQFGDLIWKELYDVFNDMMLNIEGDAEDEKEMCESGYSSLRGRDPGSGKWHYSKEEAKLCKILLRLHFWIDGLKQDAVFVEKKPEDGYYHWVKREDGGGKNRREKELQSYLRCLVGKVTMVRMLGQHCKLGEVAHFIKDGVKNMRKEHKVKGKDRICDEIDSESVGVGGKLIWDELIRRLNNYERKEENTKMDLKKVVAGKTTLHERKREGKNRKNCPAQEKKEKIDKDTLADLEIKLPPGKDGLDIGEDSLPSGKEALGKVLNKVLKEAVTEAKEGTDDTELVLKIMASLEKKLQQHIGDFQKKKATLAAPNTDDDCKGKADLCPRVKCVAKTWTKIREGSSKFGERWPSTFWDHDVAKELERLSEAMTNNTGDTDNLCEELNGKGKTSTEAEKKACQYITKALQHIYTTQEDKDDENVARRKSNRPFKQTMSCAALNLYADMLIKKTEGQPCPITEDKIRKMFGEGNGKQGDWCTGREGEDMKCDLCERKPNLNCEIEYKGNGYETKDKVERKVNDLLQKDTNITNTLTDISNATTLCQQANCVATNWFIDRKGYTSKQNWCNFWEWDVKKELERLSEAMFSNNEGEAHNLCEKINGASSTVTEAEKAACNVIVKGLKHIYETKTVEVNEKIKDRAKEEKKHKNNRQLYQTMSCIFLNAYADKLEQLSPCPIGKDIIKEAFKEGKGKMSEWCTEPPCVECKRDDSYKSCPLNVEGSLWTDKKKNNVTCDKNGNNMKKEVDKMLEDDLKITQTFTTINNATTLCDRVKCIYHRWGENRKVGEQKQDPEKFWDPDVKTLLVKLSTAITKTNGTAESLCENIKDGSSTISGPNKEECQYIVRSLKHIYQIEKGQVTQQDIERRGAKNEAQREKEDNLIFHRTFSCILLNIFADEMKKKCPNVKEEEIIEMFKTGNTKKDTWCLDKDKVNGDCVQCDRYDSYTTCKINVQTDGDTIGNRMKTMLQQNGQIMGTITTACPTKPASTQSQPATTPASSIESRARSESSGASEPAKSPPAPASAPVEPSQDSPTPSVQPGKTGTVDCKGGVVQGGENATLQCLGVDDDISTPKCLGENCDHNDDVLKKGTFSDTGVAATVTTTKITFTNAGPDPNLADSDQPRKTVDVLQPVTPVPTPPPANTPDGSGAGAAASAGSASEASGPGANAAGTGDQKDNKDTLDPSSSSSAPTAPGPLPGAGVAPGVAVRPNLGGSANTQNPTSSGGGSGVIIGISVTSYLLWKYFALPHKRKRYKRAHKVRGPPSLEEQIMDHGMDNSGLHEYILVKERRQPRSTPQKRRKQVGMRGVGHRTIIDIHLEVLDECQKGDLHSTKEDFFEILVQEFIGSEFIKEEKVPKEQFSMVDVHKEQVPSSDSGF